jgi:hypothetical protein
MRIASAITQALIMRMIAGKVATPIHAFGHYSVAICL